MVEINPMQKGGDGDRTRSDVCTKSLVFVHLRVVTPTPQSSHPYFSAEHSDVQKTDEAFFIQNKSHS